MRSAGINIGVLGRTFTDGADVIGVEVCASTVSCGEDGVPVLTGAVTGGADGVPVADG